LQRLSSVFRRFASVSVASVLFVCCICLQRLSSVFRRFASVSDVYCKCFSCFRRILQVFYPDVVYVLQ
jgi:hypothetical protein